MKGLHVPTKENPREFDDQILALSKILNDSINKKGVKKFTGIDPKRAKDILDLEEDKNLGSIYWIEAMLVEKFDLEKDEVIETLDPLFKLQKIRSSGVAHRRGYKYDKTKEKVGLNNTTYQNFFGNLLKEITNMLHYISDKANI